MLEIHGKTPDGKAKVYKMTKEELEEVTASEFKVCVGIAQTGNAKSNVKMMSDKPLEFPGVFKALDLAEEIATTNVTISKAIQNPVVEKVMNFFEKKPFKGSEIYKNVVAAEGATLVRQEKKPKNVKSKRGSKPAPVLQELEAIEVSNASAEENKAEKPKKEASTKEKSKATKKAKAKKPEAKTAKPKAEKPKAKEVVKAEAAPKAKAPAKKEVAAPKVAPKVKAAAAPKAEEKEKPAKKLTPAQEKAKKELEKIKSSPAAKAIVIAVNTADKKPSKKPSLDELISIAK